MDPSFNLIEYIMHHVTNSNEWHVPFLAPIKLPGILTVHLLMLLIGSMLLLIVFLLVYRKNQRVPTGVTGCLEAMVQFIRDEVAVPNLGSKDGIVFTPMLCSLFFFILFLNVIGLVPGFLPGTANINVTGPLAFLILVLLTVGTLFRNGPKGMWHALVPSSLPGWLIPMFFCIEVFSIFVRCGALMIRLFGNMFAGHIVILAFLGLVVMFGWFALPAVLVAIFIYMLEVFIALLQAYIFVLLSAIFIGQMYHPDH